MIRQLLLCLLLSVPAAVNGQAGEPFSFRNGDLLFQDLDCGDLCDAIEKVTPALGDRHFSHVGIAYVTGDSTWVIEAIGKDVHLTSLNKFLDRQKDANGKPKVVVGRLRPAYEKLSARAVTNALARIGKPYDELFLYGDDAYYCSELVYDAFKEANGGVPFFNLYPMTFKDPATGKTFPAWKEYYRSLKHKIPEGRQGCNPGSIAISDAVLIVSSFY